MKTLKMTYQEFQKLCAEAWKTEGQGSREIKEVHDCLLRCEKNPGMSANQAIASAWKEYLQEESFEKANATNVSGSKY